MHLPGGGSFKTLLDVPQSAIWELPSDMDPLQVAALVNPALSCWMALRHRCPPLPKDFTAVVLGATSLSGSIAVSLLRKLGAKHVAGVARDETVLEALTLDESVALKESVEEIVLSRPVDVVLDYLNDLPALRLLKGLRPGKRTHFIQIGSLAGDELVLPAHVLRSKDLFIYGSGLGSFSVKAAMGELEELLHVLKEIPHQKIEACRLVDIEQVWKGKQGRIVFIPKQYSS